MATGQNRLSWVMDWKVDQQSFNQMMSQLKQIQDLTVSDYSQMKGFDIFSKNEAEQKKYISQLETAKTAAKELELVMRKAFNTKLNTVNLSQLKRELDLLGGQKGLAGIYNRIGQIGPIGQKAFNDFASKVFTTNTHLKESNKLLKDLSISMANTVKWGITSSIFNNITNSISQAWGYAKRLDTSLNDIRIVTGKSADEMERFALQANKAAQSLGKTTTDYTEASLIYYQQGLNENAVRARTNATLKAANVTGQSTSSVSEQLTAVWNGFNLDDAEIEKVELYVDKLAAVAATTAADLEELSVGMSKVASAANTMDVSIDQLAAQMATIVSVTRQAPESVGTALKTIYARMGDIEAGLDSEISLGQYTSEMYKFGINVLDVDGHLRSMGEVIEEIGRKWTSFSKEQQVALSQVMAGTRQYNNLLSLFNNWDMYTDALQTSQTSAGELQRQQNIYLESTAAHLEKLEAAWERIYQSLADQNAINGLIDVFTDLTNLLANFTESLGGLQGLFWTMGPVITKMMSGSIGNVFATQITNSMKEKENVDMQKIKTQIANDFLHEKGKTASSDYVQDLAKTVVELGAYSNKMNEAQQQESNNFIKRKAHLLEERDQIKLNIHVMENYINSLRDFNNEFHTSLQGTEYAKRHNYQNLADQDSYNDVNLINDSKTQTTKQMWEMRKELTGTIDEIFQDWESDYKLILNRIAAIRSTSETGQMSARAELYEISAQIDELEANQAGLDPDSKLYQQNEQKIISLKKAYNDLHASTEKFWETEKRERTFAIKTLGTYLEEFMKMSDLMLDHFLNSQLASEEQIETIQRARQLAQNVFITKIDTDPDGFFYEDLEEFSDAMGGIKDATEDVITGTGSMLRKIETTMGQGIVKNLNTVEDGIKDLNEETKSFTHYFDLSYQIESATRLAASVAQIGSVISNVVNLYRIWNNETLSTGEKVLQITTNLGMTLTFAITAIKDFKDSLQGAKSFLYTITESVRNAQGVWSIMHSYIEDMNGLTPTLERNALINLRYNQILKQQELILSELNEEQKENLRLQAARETDLFLASKQSMVDQGVMLGQNAAGANKLTKAWMALKAGGLGLAVKIAAVAAALGAVAIAVYAVIKAYNKDADAAKKAAEEAEELKNAYNDAKTAADNFKDSLTGYKTAIDNMKKLEKGTLEYKKAVLEANEKALELLETHKQLAQYAQYDDGVITFNEEGMNKLLEQQIVRSQQMQIDYLAGLIRSNEAQDQANITTFIRKNKYEDVDGEAIYNTIIRDYEKYNGQVSEKELWNRSRRVQNADGTYSTVDSFSRSDLKDGVEVLLSTVVKDAAGKYVKISEDEAVNYYFKTGGANSLGEFPNAARATVFAEALHEAQDYYFKGALGEYKLMSQEVSEELIRDIANYMYDNDQTSLLESELMNIESFVDASMELKNSILWNIEEYEKMANSLNDSRRAQEAYTKQATESYLKMRGIINDDGQLTVKEIITTRILTTSQGIMASEEEIEEELNANRTGSSYLSLRHSKGAHLEEEEADRVRAWYSKQYGVDLERNWLKSIFNLDRTAWEDTDLDSRWDLYNQSDNTKTGKTVTLQDMAELYYNQKVVDRNVAEAELLAGKLAPKIEDASAKAAGSYGEYLAKVIADSSTVENGKVKFTDDLSFMSQNVAKELFFGASGTNIIDLKQALKDSGITKDLGLSDELAEQFFNKLHWYLMERAVTSDASALGASTIKTWNSHADTTILEALSGDLTSDNLTETFTMLVAEAEKLKSLYPELGVAVDTFTSKGLIGTEQWYQALYQIQDKLHELQEASVKEDFSESYDKIQEKFKDGDQIDIKAWLDSKNFENELDDILDKDYAVNVEIHAQAEDYFDTFDTATDNLIDLASKIGEGYVVAADDIRAVGNAFPGILNGMQKAEDGSVKLKKSMVKSATDAAKEELRISAETTIDKLKDQATELRGKQAIYKGMYEAALALQKKDADVDAETKKIKEGFQKLENENDQKSTDQKQDNQASVANDSKEQGQIVAENWNEAYESAADSAIAFAKTAVSAHDAAESGDASKITKGDFNVNYTGRAAASSEGAKLAELKTDFENATSDEDYEKLAQSFKNAMDALGKQANDIESMAAGVSAQYLEAINSLNNIGLGKGKDGKDNSKDPDKAELEDKYDIYHDINIEIQQITNKLDELQEKEKEVFGTALIENLRDQIRKLDAQIDNYNQKLAIAQGEALTLATSLSNDYGFVFYKDGTVANYKEVYENEAKKIQAVYDKYTSMSAEEQKKYEETKETAEKRWEDFLKELERYDRLTTEEIPNILKAQREDENSKIEKQIQKFSMEVEIRLDLSEAEKDWNNFRKKMSDDDLWTAANADLESLSTYFKDNDNGLIQATARHLDDVRAELITMDWTGSSHVYGTDRVKALEDLKKYYEQLMKDLEEVDQIVDNIQQSYVNMMKETKDAFNEQVNAYKQITSLFEHDMKIIKLLNGEDSYRELDKYYEKIEKNNRQQLDFQKQQVEFWKEEMDNLDPLENEEAWKTAKDNWVSAVNELNSLIESSIETLQDKYLNTIEKIFDDLNNKITNGKGLDYISEEWDLLGQNSDEFLDEINSLYGIEDIARKYQDAIDGTDNLATQKKLREVMEEELEALREKDKLTEYDIERAEKKYNLTLKQIALEEAQQNKSQLRLRRDSQGNYTYQYTADESAVSEAEKELADARNELYNFDLNQYKDKLEQLYDVYEEYQEKMKEAAQINDPDERAARELLIQEQYGELINGLVAQNEEIRNNLYESAFAELAALRNQELVDYTNLTQKEKDLLMNDLIPQWNSGIQEMADIFAGEGGFIPTCKESLEELDEATKEYEKELNQLEKAAGADFDAIEKGIDEAAEATKDLIQDNEDLIQSYRDEMDAIGEVLTDLDDLIERYKKAKEAAEDATEAAYKYWRTANEDTADEAQRDKYNPVEKEPEMVKPESPKFDDPEPEKPTTGGDGIISIGDKVTFIGGSGRWYADSFGGGTSGTSSSDRQVTITRITSNPRASHPYHIDGLGWVKKSQLKGYDTGGYTGTWGEEGRLALLHQKELVLNAQDTSNMLNAVEVLRDITNTIGSTMLNRLAQLNGNANGILAHVGAETMEQNVHIDATFPNVQSSHEIEDALKNLTNIAAQRAFRS